jgi:hypothetical protein
MEGSGRDLFFVLSLHLAGGTEEYHENLKIVGVQYGHNIGVSVPKLLLQLNGNILGDPGRRRMWLDDLMVEDGTS